MTHPLASKTTAELIELIEEMTADDEKLRERITALADKWADGDPDLAEANDIRSLLSPS